jgi:hypothetical protein
MIPQIPKWLDRYEVTDPDDHQSLEVSAAVHEFGGGLKRDDAEAKAHSEYTFNKAVDAAAHHYLGMRAAAASKNDVAAKKHGESYVNAMTFINADPYSAPPKMVMDRIEDLKTKLYSYKSHPADFLIKPNT